MAMKPTSTRPAKDEWGVYDPQQAGLAALYARLDANKDSKAVAPVRDPIAKPEPAPPARPSLRDAQ